MTYYSEKTRDGAVFGFAGKNSMGVHLTLFYKDGKLRSHITDTRKNEPYERTPWGTQFNPRLLIKKVEHATKNWIKPKHYHPSKKAWVVPASLRRKLELVYNPSNKSTELPIEEYMRFTDIAKWRRVLIRDLLKRSRPAISYAPTLSYVFPVDEKRMIVIPLASEARLTKMIFREYGFEKYLEYVVEQKLFTIKDLEHSTNRG